MPLSSSRDPRLDLVDYRPDVHGLVEGPAETPQEIVERALAVECPDCLVNVFIERSDQDPTGFELKIAHDASCPWLTAHEKEEEST